MNDSILTDIKKLIGIDEDDTEFDTDIIIAINSVIEVLREIGIGPESGLMITDKTTKWSALLGDDVRLNTVKTFMYLKVRQIFDPPKTSAAAEAANSLIKEFEWRLYAHAENESNS